MQKNTALKYLGKRILVYDFHKELGTVPMEILEVSEDGKFWNYRLDDGTTDWMRTRRAKVECVLNDSANSELDRTTRSNPN